MIALQNIASSFIDRWRVYFKEQRIEFVDIDIFDSGVLTLIAEQGIDRIFFDLTLYNPKNRIATQFIVPAIENLGVNIFPGSKELWHFDDKIAQKYLFESLKIPCCPTTVFYDKNQAKSWARREKFPKIFKLKSGAGSANVVMVKTAAQAERFIDKMFGSGICAVPSLVSDLSVKASRHRKARDWGATLKRLPNTLHNIREMYRSMPHERGYVYFQEFMSGNDCDTRVTIIGDRAFAFRRMVRKDDFRASGSGNIDWSQNAIDPSMINLAFTAAERIQSRCMAFDLIYDCDKNPVVVECCYGFVPDAIAKCPGYWDKSMSFHCGTFFPQDLIAQDMLNNGRAKQ